MNTKNFNRKLGILLIAMLLSMVGYLNAQVTIGSGDATTSYKSAGAGTLSVKAAGELEYFIVYYDKDAFIIQSLDANGVLKYKAVPAQVTEKTFMNIVFKVK